MQDSLSDRNLKKVAPVIERLRKGVLDTPNVGTSMIKKVQAVSGRTVEERKKTLLRRLSTDGDGDDLATTIRPGKYGGRRSRART